ncbi:type II CAAX prenyl endopeptidase Rce1 family protein [Dyadobacter sp. 3J3]|uniref:CPBP family glutamic-type intramembrane protease n=1 Tax=Dyadobacter sp. 3J3 TaxID=2606600 RepID=UPI0038D45B35
MLIQRKLIILIVSIFVFIGLRKSTTILISQFVKLNFTNPNVQEDLNIYYKVLGVVFFAPIFETFVFFYLPFTFLLFCFKNITMSFILTFIIFSAASFGVIHNYNISYLFNAIIAGALYAAFYLLFYKQNMSAFWSTVLLHAAYNSVTLIDD